LKDIKLALDTHACALSEDPRFTRRSFLATLSAAGLAALTPAASRASRPESQDPDPLLSSFEAPPQPFKPWVYWWWLDGAVTKPGITADLEAMQKEGIGGVLIFDAGIGGPDAPKGPPFMSPQWRENFHHALTEAARLNLELSVNLCSGWNAGGPWVPREDAIKRLVWQETLIHGPTEFDREIPRFVERRPDESAPSMSSTEAPTLTLDDPTEWYRDIAILACAEKTDGVWKLEDIHDLTAQSNNGRLRWHVPAGTWRVLRLGYIVPQYDEENGDASIRTKTRSAQNPASWEIDPMSEEAMDRHFAQTAAKLVADAGALAGTTFKYVHIDSWEIGLLTWSEKFLPAFEARRKYSPLLYLPGLAGKIVESPEITARFIWDYRRTIADLIAANYYGRLAHLAHAHGLGAHPESGGPWYTQYIDAMQCAGTNDIPMAEYWSSRKNFSGTELKASIYSQGVSADFFKAAEPALPAANFGSIKQASATAHVYGKALCQGEAFTNYNPDWTEDPYFLKPYGDRAFCLGLTRNVLCFYVAQANLADKPGYEWEETGLHFDRNVTWWTKSSAWLAYLARCQYLLRKGLFCADLLYFTGESIPNFALCDRKPIAGYDYDFINAEALLARAQARDGRIVLPDGLSYRYLVLPEGAAESMTPAVIKKLRALVEGGITLVGAPPKASLGLTDYPRSQREIESEAVALWGDRSSDRARKVGAGRVIAGRTVSEVIEADGLAPDVEIRGARDGVDLDWVHRGDGQRDIYFIANLSDVPADINVVFRVSDRIPELWDPVTASSRNLEEFQNEGGRIALPLELAAKQSVFIVFRKPLSRRSRRQQKNVLTLHELSRIAGPWQVNFDPKWGGPAAVVFEKLDDWSTRPEDGIRYYSGTALYRNAFTLAAPLAGRLYLDLGVVKNLAQVRINRHDAGIIWTAPWRVDIDRLARVGRNELEIEVVNLWPNRLIGDAALPDDRRITKTNVGTYAAKLPAAFFCAWDEECEARKRTGAPAALLSSGLLGPVRVMAGSY
jgi:alpha-L-rhamnosidase